MIYSALPEGMLDAWFAHCEEVFDDTPAGYFERHYRYDPDADPALILVAMDGPVIASTLRVFVRRIWLAGRAVSMGGIGEVSTKAAYRRQGHAGRLLDMAIDAMQARNMPISILFGDEPLYARKGWRFCASRFEKARVDALPPLPSGMRTRPFVMEDLDAIMGLYDLYAGRMNGALLRTEAYWRRWVLPQWNAPTVLLEGGLPVAYASTHIDEGGCLAVDELAAAPQAEGALLAMLGAIARRDGCEHVLGILPLLPHASSAETIIDPQAMMVRMNLPLEGIADSDALALAMGEAGMCPVDHM